MTEEEMIYDGSNIDEWDDVDEGPKEYNDYELQFVNVEDVEKGDYVIGEYTGTREIGGYPNAIFDNHKEEVSYAFTTHMTMKKQLNDIDYDYKVDNPVKQGETVAVVYDGTFELDNQPNDAHAWKLKRPPENSEE